MNTKKINLIFNFKSYPASHNALFLIINALTHYEHNYTYQT